MDKLYKMVAITLPGLESVLGEELKNLGAQDVQEGVRNVSFVGDKGFMYKANLSLRTALRILKPIHKFKVRSEKDLYNGLQKLRWEKYLNDSQTFAIQAAVHSDYFTTNSHYISLKSKDAIADYFRHKYSRRPSVDLKHPHLRIHIHINKDYCQVSLDSSGQSLHKRGYRSATNMAPINEVLAAGMVLLSGYKGGENFIDPMCGSGTVLIEAAMIACDIPANINRPYFGFEKWNDFDEDLFEIIHDALLKKIKNPSFKIMGFDKAPSAVRKANENIKNANLDDFVAVHHVNFFNSQKEVHGPTKIVFNPPYGERLKIDDLTSFYSSIGDTLKHQYHNTQAWFITSDFEALKHVGLRTSKRIALKNGQLDCKLVCYDIYEGSRKASKQNNNSEA